MADGSKKYLVIDNLQERSITLTPATRRMSIATKSERQTMSEENKGAVAKMDLSDEAKAAVTAAMGELEKAKEVLGPTYDKIVAAITGALSDEPMDEEKVAAQAKAAELEAAAKAALGSLDMDKPEVGAAADALAKALKSERKVKHEDDLPPHLKARLDAAIAKAEEAEQRIAKAERQALKTAEVAKCEKIYKHVPAKPADLADMLLGMDGDRRKAAEEMLARVDGLMAKSAALSEYGHTGAEGGGSALSKLKAIAKTYRDADPNMTEAAAMTKAQRLNPELRKQYDEER